MMMMMMSVEHLDTQQEIVFVLNIKLVNKSMINIIIALDHDSLFPLDLRSKHTQIVLLKNIGKK
jgi:hypothetical protein